MKQLIAGIIVSTITLAFLVCDPAWGEPASKKSKTEKPLVILSTTLGDITLELYPDKAPITVKNFLEYVDSGFYNATLFHRVIPGFVIQGGGMIKDMKKKKTRPPIKNEADNGLWNKRGTLSMARSSAVNSATSQFFINLKDNSVLDNGVRDFGYAVFAKVADGMAVVDKIAAVKTGTQGMSRDVPVEDVILLSAKRK